MKEIEAKVLEELPKCQIHPRNIFQNKNCRQCKKIREDFDQKKQQILEEMEVKNNGSATLASDSLPVSQLISQNQQFPMNCDPKSGNLPEMLRNNILSSQYFKDLYSLKSCNEVINEIQENVTSCEPWLIGANCVPTTLFCCLYKFMLMRLNEKQV